MTKRVLWFVMTLLALSVAGYAVALLVAPHARSPFDVSLFARLPLPVVLHLLGGSIALAGGALQMSTTLRRRHIVLHRWLGRLYVLAVCVAALAGLRMAVSSSGGIPTHAGFGMLAALWLGTTLLAFLHARARRIDLHHVWMVRSYALTLAAVTLRIYLPLSLIAGLPFDSCYVAISWLCWVPNLVIADWWILGRKSAASPGPAERRQVAPAV